MSPFKLRAVALVILICVAPASAEEVVPSYVLQNGETVTELDVFKECDVCPEMIVMPMGSFMMGASEGESWAAIWDVNDEGPVAYDGPNGLYNVPHEHPQHNVLMDTPYAMGVNEVTHAEWMVCVREGGCSHDPDHTELTLTDTIQLGPDHPVIDVSLLDIQEYVAWLNARVGSESYRLPTEAEWEYAARAGTTTRFAQGDMLTADQANFSEKATNLGLNQPFDGLVNRESAVPVHDLDAANGWGLRHMSGNVSEITISCFLGPHIGLPTNSDYLAHAAKGCDRYVAKGGAHNFAMDQLRLAARWGPTESSRRSFYGFRLVRVFPNKGPLS